MSEYQSLCVIMHKQNAIKHTQPASSRDGHRYFIADVFWSVCVVGVIQYVPFVFVMIIQPVTEHLSYCN